MSVPTDDLRMVWSSYCRMTCEGGSEHGVCPCSGPRQCEMQGHPDFSTQREIATIRMVRHFFQDTDEKLE